MFDFPRSLLEFQRRFPDERAVRRIWRMPAGRTAQVSGLITHNMLISPEATA